MLTRRLASRLAAPIARSNTLSLQTRSIASSTIRRAATSHGDGHHGHDSHYDAPSGWLWGDRPGEKYEKEGWENLFYWGFCGSWVVAIIAYAMKEDTSIQTWALEEARRRLEKEGILDDASAASK